MKATITLLVLATLHGPAGAQGGDSKPSIPLYGNLGPYTRPITTSADMAQKYFDQGLQLAYGFGRGEAVESFRMAQKYAPECAMCYWGEAWALGPYQNGRMDAEANVEAYAAIHRAQELADGATAVEKALIEAMAVRYVAEHTEENRGPLDQKYADAMRRVVTRHPRDLDAGTLFAEALIVLHPWDLYLEDGTPRPAAGEAIRALESVLARNIRHAGACHLYIHSVEASSTPERAEACADLLGDAMPGASHIQHMPSHIYMRIGRYGDGVRANQKANLVDQAARLGRGAAIYAAHNIHMLSFAAWMDGQGAIAIRAARDLARDRPEDAFNHPVILVRFGRWQEVLELDEPDERFQQGMWAFARGLSQLRLGEAARAETELARLDGLIDETPEDATYRGRHPQRTLLGTARGLLAGEIASADRRFDEAIAALREAVRVEDTLAYTEPENWPIPPRHVLGAVLLEAGLAADAERVYREDLVQHPENGWSLFGLAASLTAQGRDEEAAAVQKRFEKAWQRSDVILTSSRF